MKICLVSPYDISKTGGVTNHIVNYAIELRDMGKTVTILTTSSNERFHLQDIKIINLGKPVPIHFGSTVAQIFLNWKSFFKIKNFFEKNKFDIVHIHEPLVPFISIFSIIFSKSKTIVTFHATLKKSWMFMAWGYLFKPWLEDKEVFIAVSESAKNSLRRYGYNLPIQILPNGVSKNFFYKSKNNKKNNKIKILFVGRNEERKGVEILIESFKILKSRQLKRNFELIMIGENIEKLKKKYNYLEDCKFLAQLEGKDLVDHYYNSDILCSPAIENESFGIVLIEAMASKAAVLASDINGYNDLVDNKNGLLFKNKDINDLSNKLTLLIENDNLRNNLINNGYRFSTRYNWQNISKDIYRIYNDQK